VVTDMMMPVMSGAELIRRLRSDPATAGIPILAASGDSHLAVEADAVVAKPYSLHRLVELADAFPAGPQPAGLVGMPGLEPGASCSQSRRATKLRHIPIASRSLPSQWARPPCRSCRTRWGAVAARKGGTLPARPLPSRPVRGGATRA
jgi:DNA-binding response OmpR family regulator